MAAPPTKFLTLVDYFEQRPVTTFRRLYQQPSTVFAVFRRMLPHLAKTIVMALLYMPSPMLLRDLDTWIRPEAKLAKNQALSALTAYHIVQITNPKKDKPQEMSLTKNFKDSMRLALEGGGKHDSFGVPSRAPVPEEVTVNFLDRFATKKWEEILYWVVSSAGNRRKKRRGADEGSDDEDDSNMAAYASSGVKGPRTAVKNLLASGGLVRLPDEDDEVMKSDQYVITENGFTFLLQEANAQVWTLLLQWLEAAELAKDTADVDSTDMLSFLFMLGSLELGRAYEIDALTDSRRQLLPSLVDFGLVYTPRSADTNQYFPTRLATTLTSSVSPIRNISAGFDAAMSKDTSGTRPADQDQNGPIILETNYRLYAYTSSPLQIAVLHLFTKLKMRFSGMITARIDNESVQHAIKIGITADQIIAYLASHAHEQMHRAAAAAGRPVLPPTVVDQIRLWQLENERMTTQAGFLMKEFGSVEEYTETAAYAEELGLLKWRSDKKQMFFATNFKQLASFLNNRKKAAGGA